VSASSTPVMASIPEGTSSSASNWNVEMTRARPPALCTEST
jgi:hypothetical protein